MGDVDAGEALPARRRRVYVEEAAPNPANDRWSLIIAAILLLVAIGVLIWNYIRQNAKPSYRATPEPLPNYSPPSTLINERVADNGVEWNPATAAESKKYGLGAFSLKPVAVAGAYNPFAAAAASGDGTTTEGPAPAPIISNPIAALPGITEKDIEDYINSSIPVSPDDLALTRCDDGANAIFMAATKMPNGSSLPSKSGGYCILKCDYARLNQDDGAAVKFINDKDEKGNYLVNYELSFWIDPNYNSAGYEWYCKPLPSVKLDGIGWNTSGDGIYQRRQVSPVYYQSTLDPYLIDLSDPNNVGGNANRTALEYDLALCSSPTLPIPSDIAAKGYKGSQRWGGKITDNYYKVCPIGHNNKNYHLFDFQMIGRYCYWVGHDIYPNDIVFGLLTPNGNNSGQEKNLHGDYTKVPLQDKCPKVVAVDAAEWIQMQLTPSSLSCYYCPKLYEYDEIAKSLFGYITVLRGNESDGYVCVRECPKGMSDRMAGPLHWCIPEGIHMKPWFSKSTSTTDPNK